MTTEAPAAPAVSPAAPSVAAPAAPTDSPQAPTPAPAAPAPPAPAPAATPAETPKTLLGSASADPKPGDEPGASKPQAAPEKYEGFTLPEGIQPDTALLDKAVPLFKELKLSQEAAQKLVTLQAEHAKANFEAVVKQAETQRAQFLEGLKQQTIKDLGPDYLKELAFAAKAMDHFGGQEFRKLMDETGLGMHPLMAKTLIAIGKTMSEDTPPGPTNSMPDNGEEARHRSLFPSMYDENGNRKPEFAKK